MKKMYMCLLIMVLFVLSSCNKKDDIKKLSVIMPSGAPALAQAKLEHDGLNSISNLEIKNNRVSDTKLLQAAFASEDYDVIYAPINMGAKNYNNNQKYVLKAMITWGNIYFATARDGDFSIESLSGQVINFFGKGTINEAIVNKILEDKKIVVSETSTWESGTDVTKGKLISDPDAIVMIAEPVLSAASSVLMTQNRTVKKISIQDLWNDYSGNGSYPQAGIFVKKEIKDKKYVNTYFNKVSEACDYTSTHTEEVAQYAAELDYGLPPEKILIKAIPNCNISYQTGFYSKGRIEIVLELVLSTIGGKLPDENFYQK